MNEISTGLESPTTYQIINWIQQYVQIFNGTTIISLLQPAPETYDLFDDIILLSDSQIVYMVLAKMCLISFKLWDLSALRGKVLLTFFKRYFL